jgi:murein DD-endopeptidase MepM/ murein hydrolase activator NlpD
VSIGEVQSRIGTIQAQMSLLAARAAQAPAASAGSASGGTSATQFAAALDSAVAANATGAASTTSAATAGGAADGTWVKPVNGPVTSEFGPRWGTQHEGMDIAAATGTPVRSMAAGVVRRADWNGGYGNAVIIDHGNGISTLYGHNSALSVKPGQRVNAGDIIAKAGSTGDSTGPHVHLEVRIKDKQINPRPWLEARGLKF